LHGPFFFFFPAKGEKHILKKRKKENKRASAHSGGEKLYYIKLRQLYLFSGSQSPVFFFK
jgi:hypothetical protein